MARLPFARRPRLSLAIALVAGFAVALALRLLVPPEDRTLRLTPVVEGVLTDPGSPAFGSADAQVTVVVFTDYLCPVCKRTDPAIGRLLADDPGVRVVWKLWPIRGGTSDLAAETALAAHRQGRYRQVHDALMGARGELTPQRIDALAAAAGADPARLAADRAAHAEEIRAQLGRHRLQAFGLGLRGTPSYLVGPYLIEGGLDDRALRQAVARARKAGPLRP
ncbi:MAG: DsbA family protein [Pseudomonadota bacterium]|jgi:protein-disulfide isomerase